MSPAYLILLLITVSPAVTQDFTAGDFDVFKKFGEQFGFSILDNFIQNSRREFYKQQLTKAIANYDRTNPAFAQIIRSIPPDVIISALEETDSQPQQTGNAFLDVLAKNGIAVPVKKTPDGTPGEVGFKDVFSSVLNDVLEKLRLQNNPAALQESFGAPVKKTPLESTNPKDPQANRLIVPPADQQPKDLRSIILRKLAERQNQAAVTVETQPPNPFSVTLAPGATLIQETPRNPFRNSPIAATEPSFIRWQNITDEPDFSETKATRKPPRLITAAGPLSKNRLSTESPLKLPRISGEDRLKELNFKALRVIGEKDRPKPFESTVGQERFQSLFSEATPSDNISSNDDNNSEQPRNFWFQPRGSLNPNSQQQVKVVPYAALQRQNFDRLRKPQSAENIRNENSFRFRSLNRRK